MPGSPDPSQSYVLLALHVPYPEKGEVFRTYKTALRLQNSHALVNAAFRLVLSDPPPASLQGG